MRITKEDIEAMTFEEKKQLLEILWESFENNGDKNYVDDLPEETEEELQILQERLEEYRRNPEQFVDGEKFFKEELEQLRGDK